MIKFRGINRAGELDDVVSIDWMHDEVYFARGTDVATTIDQACLMQFTGLADINGEEIYVGDIVGFRDGNDEPCVSEVHSDGGASCINVQHYDYDFTAIGWAIDSGVASDMVVIGNIHQNPELLA